MLGRRGLIAVAFSLAACGRGLADEAAVVPPVAFDPEIRLAQQIQDPAIETVDEMTARPGAGGSHLATSG